MDDMSSTTGNSGWTRVDARWVPRGKKSLKKTSHKKLTSPRSLLDPRTSDAKECVQATHVVLDLGIEMQAMETKT